MVGEVPTCQNVRRTAQRAKERLRNDARRGTRERERTGSSQKKSVLRRTVERRHGEPRANLNQRSTQVRARGAALARQTLARSLILYPPRVRDRALDVPVLAQQLGRRLRPDALDAWNDVGVELKGVRSGVERRRGVSGLKARDPGRRETTGEKVLKDRRSPRERGRMGTSVILERA